MLDFRVKTFLKVCECMNYTKAAKELHITQPAVSQHISYLEDFYNVKLFYHEGKRIALTREGMLLQEKLLVAVRDEHLLRNELCEMSRPHTIRFGTTKTIGDFVINSELGKFVEQEVHVDMQFLIDNTENLETMLEDGRLNLALIEGNHDVNKFQSLVYKKSRFICVCASNYHLPNDVNSIKDLLKERLIVREEGSGSRDIFVRNLAIQNLNIYCFNGLFEVGSMHVLLDLVKQGLGIAFVYEEAVKDAIDEGTIREIELNDLHIEHDFTFIWNKNSIYSDYYQSVCEEVLSPTKGE